MKKSTWSDLTPGAPESAAHMMYSVIDIFYV